MEGVTRHEWQPNASQVTSADPEYFNRLKKRQDEERARKKKEAEERRKARKEAAEKPNLTPDGIRIESEQGP